jgi:hypothetical protein
VDLLQRSLAIIDDRGRGRRLALFLLEPDAVEVPVRDQGGDAGREHESLLARSLDDVGRRVFDPLNEGPEILLGRRLLGIPVPDLDEFGRWFKRFEGKDDLTKLRNASLGSPPKRQLDASVGEYQRVRFLGGV